MDYLLLLSSIVAGALTVFVFHLQERRHIKLLNAFTGAYLLSLTFLHLLPELYESNDGGTNHSLIGVMILIGFFVQIMLDSISMGVEHGHAHHLHGHVPFGVIAGLCLHAFVEAMALGDPATHYNPASRQTLLWSIVVHNFPVSIALLGMLLHSGLSRGRALGLLGLFAAMAPLGMLVSSHTILSQPQYSRLLMGIVIGIFMHIATTILFESSDGHRFNRQKTVAIILGTGLSLLSSLLH